MTSRRYPQGVPCWIDTEQPDVEAAITFYSGLFGWTFEDAMPPGAPGRYVIAKLDGQDVGAVAGPRAGTAVWSTYVSVDDADAAAQRLVSAGGSVLSAPADAGDGGRGAVLADPEGTEFRIWQARQRSGAQVVNAPGTWNFSDLHTTDPQAAIAFYEEAFGWQFDDLGFATMIRRPGYGDHLEATIDPDIRARQSGWQLHPASRMRSPGSRQQARTSRRTGTSRSPSPTGTRRRLMQSDSARTSLGATTPTGRVPR